MKLTAVHETCFGRNRITGCNGFCWSREIGKHFQERISEKFIYLDLLAASQQSACSGCVFCSQLFDRLNTTQRALLAERFLQHCIGKC